MRPTFYRCFCICLIVKVAKCQEEREIRGTISKGHELKFGREDFLAFPSEMKLTFYDLSQKITSS